MATHPSTVLDAPDTAPDAVASPAPECRRPAALDAGLLLITVAVPLAFTIFSWAPFADTKLVFLALGTLLISIGGVPLDRRLAIAAGAWFGVTVIASIWGVDPLRSLTGYDFPLTGLAMLAPCAYLVVAGASLPPRAVARMRRWVVWTGVLMAVVLLVAKLLPGVLRAAIPDLTFSGSTAGNPVFAAAVMTVALSALLGSEAAATRRFTARPVVTLVVLASGISLAGERSAWLLPMIAVPLTLWWFRVPIRRSLVLGAVVVVTCATWVAAQPLLPTVTSPVGQLTFAGDSGRLTAFVVHTRAALDRPVLGWGPANSFSAFRATATEAEIDRSSPGWSEAHNIFIQTAVTTGLIGLGAFVALVVLIASRARRADRRIAWVVGAVGALAAFNFYEPFELSVTPLAFLLAGVAAGTATRGGRTGAPGLRQGVGRIVIGAGLAGTLVLSMLVAISSTFQHVGERYESEWALRRSLQLQPWRLATVDALAEDLALDSRAGKPGAAEEASRLIADAVREHPWDPLIRIRGVDVEALSRDFAAARAYLRDQVERFPGDAAFLPPERAIRETPVSAEDLT